MKVESVATWVMSFVGSTGYFGIVLLMFLENVFPPIPSEVIMPLAGYMASEVNFRSMASSSQA